MGTRSIGSVQIRYKKNLELLWQKFPALGLLLPEPASFEEKKKSDLPVDWTNVEVLYVYGLRKEICYASVLEGLNRHPQKEAVFLDENLESLASFLVDPQAFEILSHPRIHLVILPQGRKRKEKISELAHEYPERRIELVSAPFLKTSRFYRLRLALFRQTTLTYSLYLDRLHADQPFRNFLQNLQQLPSSFYFNRMEEAFQGTPAVICGAGPSLEKAAPFLELLEDRALIFAGGSTLAALSHLSITPHFGVAIDPNLEEYRRLKNNFGFEVPLLYSTRVCPTVFQTCSGPFGYMRGGIGGALELWIEEQLGLQEPLLGQNLSSESLSVTCICIAAAKQLGCSPIILVGMDLAYTEGRHYSSGVVRGIKPSLKEIELQKSAADRILLRKDRHGRDLHTAVRWVMEAASIGDFAKSHPEVSFFNTTLEGLPIAQVPWLPLERVLSLCPVSEDLRGKVHREIARSYFGPHTGKGLRQALENMRLSLERTIGWLEVLAEKRAGSRVLAEYELPEEIAYQYLFYDMPQVLRQGRLGRNLQQSSPSQTWEEWLKIAKKFGQVFTLLPP